MEGVGVDHCLATFIGDRIKYAGRDDIGHQCHKDNKNCYDDIGIGESEAFFLLFK